MIVNQNLLSPPAFFVAGNKDDPSVFAIGQFDQNAGLYPGLATFFLEFGIKIPEPEFLSVVFVAPLGMILEHTDDVDMLFKSCDN